jgi:hypothetical protein
MNVSGSYLTINAANGYRSVENPIWAFIVFQTNKLKNQEKDNTFDHANVRNFWIDLDGRRYPEESLDLDFNSNYYNRAYIELS